MNNGQAEVGDKFTRDVTGMVYTLKLIETETDNMPENGIETPTRVVFLKKEKSDIAGGWLCLREDFFKLHYTYVVPDRIVYAIVYSDGVTAWRRTPQEMQGLGLLILNHTTGVVAFTSNPFPHNKVIGK